jgi:hypothetical protein
MSNKFLELLPLIEDQKWAVIQSGWIRNDRNQCPICAIVDVLSDGEYDFDVLAFGSWKAYINEKDLPQEERDALMEIMDAADGSVGCSFDVRHRLLELIHDE